jgi:molybdopterin molybdotransferase
MLSVAEALEKVLGQCRPLPPLRLPVSHESLGRVLAEEVRSDLDVPPFDKALMDGYAVRSADLASGKATVRVIEEITAGRKPKLPLAAGQASRIMTGAPTPAGADAVVMIERTKLLDAGHVAIESTAFPGMNLLSRGREMAAGEVVLRAGAVLRPQEIGVLATLGRAEALLVPSPRVAVLATGDELVDPPAAPGPGQIRNSNAPMLLAQAARAGGIPRPLGIGRDDLGSLRALVLNGLETSEILALSGGVSAGKLDLVPQVLQEAGVTAHFHKIHLKPGKPLFFGTAGGPGHKRLVFGLPGNPVSSFVCFELFLRPAIRALAGLTDVELPRVRARFTEAFANDSDRPTYHPGALDAGERAAGFIPAGTSPAARQPSGSSPRVIPVPWFGSADLRAFLQANALLALPPGKRQYAAGDEVDVLRLDG